MLRPPPCVPGEGLGAEEEQEPALVPRGASSAGVFEKGHGDIGPAVWAHVEPTRLRADAALVSTADRGHSGVQRPPSRACWELSAAEKKFEGKGPGGLERLHD